MFLHHAACSEFRIHKFTSLASSDACVLAAQFCKVSMSATLELMLNDIDDPEYTAVVRPEPCMQSTLRGLRPRVLE